MDPDLRITVEQSSFTPDQPMRWYYGEPVTVTYAGETYRSRIEWEPHDEPVAEWLIETLSSDAVSPDTSQPYPLDDLIARIDELT
jgi:hypothetical protein